ncbi:carbohydrate ABC transporter permease [Microbacterium aurantiacum]|uniref:Carbohydrate ABC transporter permease n=1 Tax=Microbacterium aurantiacum TaxID=162393 RepID=A0AAJ2HH46_9MICO|nr:carbohydrate ABC transporter permease [Microbacterium aurantiacum]MDS0244294.1 carbohydrate ABC transporter permease [Microbacterium aurantiacum]
MFRYTPLTLAREAGILVVALVMMLPFYLLINVALKSDVEAVSTPAIVPAGAPSLDSFAVALTEGSLLAGLLGSVIVTVSTVLLLIIIGSITAYVIARRVGKLSSIAYVFVLVGIILPIQMGMVPLYVAMRSLGLLGTLAGMVVLNVGLSLPLAIFLYVGFARSVPREYEEAAEVDGAGRLQTFVRIVFPLLAPATGTVAILAGMNVWNDFQLALIYLSGSDATTLPLSIYSFVGADVTRWNVIFAGLIVAIIPMLVFYLFAQRRFIQGFAGGIKS